MCLNFLLLGICVCVCVCVCLEISHVVEVVIIH
jgi:hypothetical protein